MRPDDHISPTWYYRLRNGTERLVFQWVLSPPWVFSCCLMQVDEYGSPNWARWVGYGALPCGGKIACRSIVSRVQGTSSYQCLFMGWKSQFADCHDAYCFHYISTTISICISFRRKSNESQPTIPSSTSYTTAKGQNAPAKLS